MLNIAPASSAARQPRGVVLLNGVSLPWSSIEVENNGYYAADTFRMTLPLSAQPTGMEMAWWLDQPILTLSGYAGFPVNPDHFTESELQLLIHGGVDEVDVDPVHGNIVLSGRDHTAYFLDNKTTEKFVNKTSSWIATTLATRRGLTPVVTATKTIVGTYYVHDQARMTRDITEWDLLTWLAQQEGFVVYVKGLELHFEPPAAPGDNYVIQLEQPTVNSPLRLNAISLRLRHNLTLAKDVVVKVKTFSLMQMTPIVKTSRASKSSQSTTGGTPQTYSYTIPGLTADGAARRAQALAEQISQHEMRLEATMPADTILTVQTPIELRGTDSLCSSLDQVFYPDRITRTLDENGYLMHIHAKNHLPQSVVTL